MVEATFQATPDAAPATGVAHSASFSLASPPFAEDGEQERVLEASGGIAVPPHGVAGFTAAGSGALPSPEAGGAAGGGGGEAADTPPTPPRRADSLHVRRLSEGLALNTAAAAQVVTSPLKASARSSRAPAGAGMDATPELEREKERLRQMAQRQNKEIERTIWAERAVCWRRPSPFHCLTLLVSRVADAAARHGAWQAAEHQQKLEEKMRLEEERQERVREKAREEQEQKQREQVRDSVAPLNARRC